MMKRNTPKISLYLFYCLIACCSFACGAEKPTVVVYASRDQLYAEPIFSEFERATGVRVQAVYDTGSTKTAGLTNRLLAEKDHPQADVYWNTEVVRTIVLKHSGVLASYQSPNAQGIPARYKDPEGYWTGFGARARVFIYNTQLLKASEVPKSIFELTQPQWRGKFVIGNPVLGTMAAHHTALFAILGDESARVFFRALADNQVRIVVGNTAVRDEVSQGEVPLGITDTSDVYEAIADGKPVAMSFPDQDGIGTLVIPNTIALIANSPHPEQARRFIDFMLRPETERILSESRSAQMPLHQGVVPAPNVRPVTEIVASDVDFEQIAQRLDEVCAFLTDLFIR